MATFPVEFRWTQNRGHHPHRGRYRNRPSAQQSDRLNGSTGVDSGRLAPAHRLNPWANRVLSRLSLQLPIIFATIPSMENDSRTVSALELGEATLRRIRSLTPEQRRQSLINARILLPNGEVAEFYRDVFRPSTLVQEIITKEPPHN